MGGQSQIAVYVAAGLAVLAVAIWRLWPYITAARSKAATLKVERLEPIIGESLQAVGDSDRKAPQGTREWIKEVLAAVDGAPDSLKLEILADPATTVAAAQRRFIEHLQAPAKS